MPVAAVLIITWGWAIAQLPFIAFRILGFYIGKPDRAGFTFCMPAKVEPMGYTELANCCSERFAIAKSGQLLKVDEAALQNECLHQLHQLLFSGEWCELAAFPRKLDLKLFECQ